MDTARFFISSSEDGVGGIEKDDFWGISLCTELIDDFWCFGQKERIANVDANGDARDGIVLAQHGQKRGQKHDGQIVDAVKTEIFERV